MIVMWCSKLGCMAHVEPCVKWRKKNGKEKSRKQGKKRVKMTCGMVEESGGTKIWNFVKLQKVGNFPTSIIFSLKAI